MTDRELTISLAERALGWVLIPRPPVLEDIHPFYELRAEAPFRASCITVWPRWGAHGNYYNPLESISDAFQLVEKMRERGWSFELREPTNKPESIATFMNIDGAIGCQWDQSRTRAISLACWRAVESQEVKG